MEIGELDKTWNFNQRSNALQSSLRPVEPFLSLEASRPLPFEEKKQQLRQSIKFNTQLLSSLTSESAIPCLSRLARTSNGADAARNLGMQIERAERLLHSLETNPSAIIDADTQIDGTQHLLEKAYMFLYLLTTAAVRDVQIDHPELLTHAYNVAAEALKACFWAKPFAITVEMVRDTIGQTTSLKHSGNLPRPVVNVLNYHNIPPGMRREIKSIPYFRVLDENTRRWISDKCQSSPSSSLLFQKVLGLSHHTLPKKTPINPPIDILHDWNERSRNSFEQATTQYARIAVCGLLGAGKTTLINRLIGYELLPTRSNEYLIQAEWPLVIRHVHTARSPVLIIDAEHFRPHLDLFLNLQSELYNPLDNYLLRSVHQAILAPAADTPHPNLLRFQDTQEIQKLIDSIGDMVRRMKHVSRKDHQFQINSNWPVVEVCMSGLGDHETFVEFVDLPGPNNIQISERDVRAQWEDVFQTSHAGLFVFKADRSAIVGEIFATTLEFLSQICVGKPILPIATQMDRFKGSLRQLEDDFSIPSYNILPSNNRSTSLVTCSPLMDASCRSLLRRVADQVQLPPRKELETKETQLVMDEHLSDPSLWDTLNPGLLQRYLEKIIGKCNMQNLISSVHSHLLAPALESRQLAVLRAMNAELDSVRQGYDDLLDGAYCDQQQIDSTLGICRGFLADIARFCTGWHLSRLEPLKNTLSSMSLHLKQAREKAHNAKIDVIEEIKRDKRTKNGKILFDGFVEASEFVSKVMKQFLQKLDLIQTGLETQVTSLALRTWNSQVKELETHLERIAFAEKNDLVSQQLKRTIQQKVQELLELSPKDLARNFINQLVTGATDHDPQSLFWSAHEHPKSPNDDTGAQAEDESSCFTPYTPATGSFWNPTEHWSVNLELRDSLEKFETWAQDDEIKADGWQALGFFVTGATLPSECGEAFQPQPLDILERSNSRLLSLSSLEGGLQTIVEKWFAFFSKQCQITVEGSVKIVILLGTKTVLTTIGSELRRLENKLQILSRERRLNDSQVEEIIVAEANIVTMWAAIDEIQKGWKVGHVDEWSTVE
ncbi:hypothetical protein CPB86DRAFT_820136 [Serendipita vermifera]|nr:hypothetical protein CPB86DRAFT_820136 [Serendipita vermifera]